MMYEQFWEWDVLFVNDQVYSDDDWLDMQEIYRNYNLPEPWKNK